jgi:hypothetical protein
MAPPHDGPSSANGGHDSSPADTLLERLPALAARIGSAKAKVDEARGEVGASPTMTRSEAKRRGLRRYFTGKRRSRRPSAPGPDPGGKPDARQLGV